MQSIPTSRDPNIHLIAAIGTSAIIEMSKRRDSFNAAAREYVESVLRGWEDMGNNLSELVIVHM